MKILISLIFAIAASPVALCAQEIIAQTDFATGELAPLVFDSKGDNPTPAPEIISNDSNRSGLSGSILRLDDSEASKEENGHFAVTLPFPAQDNKPIRIRTVFRISEEGLKGPNAEIDIRFSAGGMRGDDGVIATYIRIIKLKERYNLSVYSPVDKAHKAVDFFVEANTWYALETTVDLAKESYDWKLQAVHGAVGDQVEGRNENFYSPVDRLSFFAISSTGRGGSLEVSSLTVE